MGVELKIGFQAGSSSQVVLLETAEAVLVASIAASVAVFLAEALAFKLAEVRFGSENLTELCRDTRLLLPLLSR